LNFKSFILTSSSGITYVSKSTLITFNQHKMKKIRLRIALAVVMIAVGTLGLQAQNVNGTGTCGTCSASCVNASLLTDDQKVILEDLCVVFQADMVILQAELIAAPTLAEKLVIRQEMASLRTEHIAEVKALLVSWGIPVSTGVKKGGSNTGNQGRRGK
jgi:hypothetical protein